MTAMESFISYEDVADEFIQEVLKFEWKEELLVAYFCDAGCSEVDVGDFNPGRNRGCFHEAFFVDGSVICKHYGGPHYFIEFSILDFHF